ncbi:hypothetical protein ISCGN_023125 [Ixodes scapularis]
MFTKVRASLGQIRCEYCSERAPDLAFTCRQRQQSILSQWAPARANGARQSRSDSRDRPLSHRAGGGFRGGLQTQKERLPEATRSSGTASIRREKHRRACACLCVCVGLSVLGFRKGVDSLHQPPKRGKNVKGLHHLPLVKEHPKITSAAPNFEHHVNTRMPGKAPLSPPRAFSLSEGYITWARGARRRRLPTADCRLPTAGCRLTSRSCYL